ncbi:MAG: adenylyl-sulfate kinase [Myxococcota bacterium]|nr:adenylyl-sulfate kinase [Myxococcota bacterium]
MTTNNLTWSHGILDQKSRWERLGHHGATLWFTGLSGSGKSTVAIALEKALIEVKRPSYRIDGDNIRHGLCSDLGFSNQDRTENLRRAGEVSSLVADSGCLVLACFISPLQAQRNKIREIHEKNHIPFFEIYIDVPLEVCEQRDPKGLYKKARSGEVHSFTGISSPYEPPKSPDLTLTTHKVELSQAVTICLQFLKEKGLLSP